MRLYDLPRNTKLRVVKVKGEGREDATFGHADGSYSYCYFGEDDGKDLFHLSASTEMIQVGDHWELKAQESME